MRKKILLALLLVSSLFSMDLIKKETSTSLIKDLNKNNVQTNSKLPIFGHSFFEQKNNSTNLNKINIRDDYKLKVSDEILVKVYGYDNVDLNLKINKTGDIVISQYGPLKVINITFNELKKSLKNIMKSIYPNSDSLITISNVSAIEININGNIKNPGSYNVGGFSTIIDALRVANGFRDNSSLREINLTRDGTSTNIDLYEYIIGKKNFNDLMLKDGDFITINKANTLVAIDGAIERRAIYELLENESLKDLLIYAQNLKPMANTNNILLKRVTTNGVSLSYIDINNSKYELKNGDKIDIGFLVKDEQKYVIINGEVFNKGKFLFTENMTLENLIKIAEGFTYFADRDTMHIKRTNIKDNTRTLSNLQIQDINTKLMPFDIVTIKKYKNWDSIITVDIQGEVSRPGSYSINKNSSLSNLLQVADGLTEFVDLDAIYVYRKSLANMQKEMMKRKISQLKAKLSSVIFSSAVNINNTSSNLLVINLEKQINLLKEQLSSSDFSNGKIHLKLSSENDTKNFNLVDGDKIIIPTVSNFININGAVLNPSTFIYNENISLEEYIDKCGGLSLTADENSSYILKTNGEAQKINFKDNFVLKAGDIINIGEKAINE